MPRGSFCPKASLQGSFEPFWSLKTAPSGCYTAVLVYPLFTLFFENEPRRQRRRRREFSAAFLLISDSIDADYTIINLSQKIIIFASQPTACAISFVEDTCMWAGVDSL